MSPTRRAFLTLIAGGAAAALPAQAHGDPHTDLVQMKSTLLRMAIHDAADMAPIVSVDHLDAALAAIDRLILDTCPHSSENWQFDVIGDTHKERCDACGATRYRTARG